MKISRFGLTVAAAFAVGVIAAPAYAQVTGGPFQYFAVTPCRLADTRGAVGLNGGPVIDATAPQRDFQVQGLCGVPVGARAVSLNVTVAPSSSASGGWFAFFPSGTSLPLVSTINFVATDVALANGAIVSLSTNSSDLSAFLGGGGPTPKRANLILDVTGYFQ